MRFSTASASSCFGSGICTRIPCTLPSALSRFTTAFSSACDVDAGIRIVSPRMPASSHAAALLRTYTALAGSSPTSTTERPGTTPLAPRAFTCSAIRARTLAATAFPSISVPRSDMETVELAGIVHRARLPDCHDLDLSGILQLGLDATSDLLGQRAHANIVDVVRRDDDAHLATRL